MEFEEMKVIWDSQNNEPLYAVDQSALHTRIKKRGQVINKNIVWFDFMIVAIMLVVAVVSAEEPLRQGHDYHQLPLVACLILASVYVCLGIKHRLQHESQFDHLLRGDLDKAISKLDYKIKRFRTKVWWCVVPILLGTLISFVFLYRSKPVWIWLALLLSFVFNHWLMSREIRSKLLPQKRELQSLRDKLVESER